MEAIFPKRRVKRLAMYFIPLHPPGFSSHPTLSSHFRNSIYDPSLTYSRLDPNPEPVDIPEIWACAIILFAITLHPSLIVGVKLNNDDFEESVSNSTAQVKILIEQPDHAKTPQ
ncbi:hypothetical protein HOY82DRAFT_535046 [Tuber indicum]|nr:hypothetical protein HOY82DRAFT_535046 [Tuber indicum]